MHKKLVRWALDIQELSARVTKVWIKGTENILGDAPSRNPKDRDFVKDLQIPAGPIKRVVTEMFSAGHASADEIKEFNRFIAGMNPDEPDRSETSGVRSKLKGTRTVPRQNVQLRPDPQNSSKDLEEKQSLDGDNVLGPQEDPDSDVSLSETEKRTTPTAQQSAEVEPGTVQAEGVEKDESPEGYDPREDGTSSSLAYSESTMTWPSSTVSEVLNYCDIDTNVKALDTSIIDGLYPRFPVVSLLASSEGAEQPDKPIDHCEDFALEANLYRDTRIPRANDVIPVRLRHVFPHEYKTYEHFKV